MIRKPENKMKMIDVDDAIREADDRGRTVARGEQILDERE